MAATNIALKDTNIQEEQNKREFILWIVDFVLSLFFEQQGLANAIVDNILSLLALIKPST